MTKEKEAIVGRQGDYIELNRTFRDVIGEKIFDNEDGVAESYASYGKHIEGYALTWNNLLQMSTVVVLGEAGSGKSYEFRNQANVLAGDGKDAFYIELERLARSPYEQAVAEDTRHRVAKWTRENSIGYFFLDAVDESKLQRSQDFYNALDSLGSQLPQQTRARCRFYISSRISGWNPDVDGGEVCRRLCRSATDRTSVPKVVQINPLTQSQIQLYAKHRGIDTPGSFIDAVASAHAWSFVRRPVDVEDMIQYWMENGRLGTLTELIEFNIRRNSIPLEKDRKVALADSRIRVGCEMLAAATIFCKNLRFRCPPGSRLDLAAMEPAECLSGEWTPEEIYRLISLPIFDGANYGCVRFHHRRTTEYLAARWVVRCVEGGCPLDDLREVFFEQIGSRWELRLSLAPIAAWLCIGNEPWNREFRGWVLQSAPDIHWSHGDPAALDIEYRRATLRKLIERYAERKKLWLHTDRDSLERFADAKLGPDVARWIKDKSLSCDLRIEMIRLAWEGGLLECRPELLQLVIDDDTDANLRIYALMGLGALGVDEVMARALRNKLLDSRDLPQREGLQWVEVLYPAQLSPQEALGVLGGVQWGEEEGPFRFFLLLQKMNSGAKKALLQALVDSLPHPWRGKDGVEDIPAWNTTMIQEIAEGLYEDKQVTEDDIRLMSEVLYCLFWLSEREMVNEPGKLWQHTSTYPQIRRAYYWCCWERRAHSRWVPYYQMMNIPLGGQDLAWLLEDIKHVQDREARKFAKETAVGLLMGRENRKAYGPGLRHLAVHFPALILHAIFLNLRMRWARYTMNRVGWRWRRMQMWARDHRARISNWVYIRKRIIRMRRGQADGLLCRLIERPYCSSKDWGEFWRNMTQHYGRLVVWAVRHGSKSLWQKDRPPYYCEMEKPGRILLVYGGLVGIYESIESGELNMDNLTSREAEALFRYSLYDWNRYPDWFGTLVGKQSALVKGQIEYCLNMEWGKQDIDGAGMDMFRRLQFEEGEMNRLAIPRLMQLVEGDEPKSKLVLEMAWRIILNNSKKMSGGDARLSALIACKLPHYDRDSKTYAYALITWLYAGLGSAMDYLEAQEMADPLSIRKRMHNIFATYSTHSDDTLTRLWRRGNRGKDDQYIRYLRLLYRCVHPAADVPTPTGCFSPEGPWAAQEYRDQTFSHLGRGLTAEAGELLKMFAEDPQFADYRDWFLSLRDKQMRARADQARWEPSDIPRFPDAYAITPKNDSDLYRLVRGRLREMKYWVEVSDSSPREEVYSDHGETVFRAWVARRLQESSLKKYDITQESVLDQEQRRDIRIGHPCIKGPVTIEIKKACEWSGNKLFERLENQLFGQYLRDPDARYGIYLLGYFGSQEQWQHDGRDLNWGELIAELQVKADELARLAGKGGEVRVVGIDFRKPV